MHTALAIGFFILFLYLLIQSARHETIQDDYEDIIIDVEGRLDWARSRPSYPFGMRTQINMSNELLGKSKILWNNNKWHQALRVALQSQEAINRAQNIYRKVINL